METHSDATCAESLSLDEGRLVVSRDWLSLLQASNLDTFERVMACKAGTAIRSLPGRNTVQLELKSATGNPRIAYLKRYTSDYLSVTRLLHRLLRLPSGQDEAMHEWRMIHVLRKQGILTAAPIAAGHLEVCGVTMCSFVMTADIQGGVPGNEYVKRADARRRRELIPPLAELARRFHGAGFIHRDFYLAHVFVVADEEKLDLFLIDLQRVLGPNRFRERWLVKDIGSLAYSAQKVGVSRTDLLRFYKFYSAQDRLKASDRRFIQKLMDRVRWLHGRTPKYGEEPAA